MYSGHFGLDDGPFHGTAEGEDVYVGPQQAVVVSRLRKALGTGDTAVAVSGPVGVGKTTLVRHAIAGVAGRKVVISVDRMRLEPDEVLDLLLSRFDVSRQPKGTIQRVSAFRRLLQERLSDDIRVFIIVEDAGRVGVDALIELEALTATDAGEPVGANIVLMGDSDLPSLLARPALVRLRQRIRLRQGVAPFDAAEVEGYMRHCLEAAGGVLEQIFEPGTTRIVHRCSGGIARVIDNLCEAALVAAAEAGLATILPEFLQEVAANCGLESQVAETGPIAGEPAEISPAAVDQTVDDAPAGCAPADAEPALTPAAPPKLALVERPAVPAEDPHSEDAPELQRGLQQEPQQQPESGVHDSSPPVDTTADDECEAEPAPFSPDEERTARSTGLTVSRTDEVLPQLLERLQSSARGPNRPASAFALPAVAPADDNDIPTLSNSMRIAALPVQRLDERPLTADDACEPAPDQDTGFAAALTEEIAPELVPDPEPDIEPSPDVIEPPVREIQQVDPVEHAVANIEPPAVEPSGLQERPDEAAGEEQPAADSVELALPADDSFSPGTVVAEESGDEETTEAATLSIDEELTFAPDSPTETVTAESDAGKAAEPELDALEAAIQAANAWQVSDAADAAAGQAAAAPADKAAAGVPEITLDEELEKQKPSPTEQLDRWAEELSKAKSLEDISEILAETIFGNEEIEAISAEIRAKKAAGKAAAEPAAAPPPEAAPARPAIVPSRPKPAPATARRAPAAPSVSPASPARPSAGGINMTLSQRIQMVNSLKGRKPSQPLKPLAGMSVAEIVLAAQPDEPLPKAAGSAPAPIEAQIDTAITQSRKALSEADLARMASSEYDEVDEGDGDGDRKGSRGLFGFFRRSSKS